MILHCSNILFNYWLLLNATTTDFNTTIVASDSLKEVMLALTQHQKSERMLAYNLSGNKVQEE